MNYHTPDSVLAASGVQGAVASGRSEARRTLPFALKLILLTLFIPPELSFFVAGLRLTCTRLVLIILTPFVFVQLAGKLARGRYRFVLSDLFAPLAALWIFVGPGATFGFSDSLVHSGPIAVEFLTSYLSTRVMLSGNGDSFGFRNLLCILIALVAIDGMLDVPAGYYVTRTLASQITHYLDFYYNEDSVRFGLLRASGTLEHPILFGFTMAIGLIFSYGGRFKGRKVCMALSGIGLLISLSSAPQQCGIMGIGFLVYGRMFKSWRHKWWLLATPPLAVTVVLFLSTDTPFGHIVSLATIDPQTGYYRLYIWQMVGPAILQNPFFAVMPTDYDYQGSVDSVWLVLSLDYGMICSIFTALAIIGSASIRTSGWPSGLSAEEQEFSMAVGIVLFLIIFMGFTVDYWGSVWILVGLLTGLRAHLGELASLKSAAKR